MAALVEGALTPEPRHAASSARHTHVGIESASDMIRASFLEPTIVKQPHGLHRPLRFVGTVV